MCAGGDKGKDSCVGDSGSALMRDMEAGIEGFPPISTICNISYKDHTSGSFESIRINIQTLNCYDEMGELVARTTAHLEDNRDRELRSAVLRHRGHPRRVHAGPQLRAVGARPRGVLKDDKITSARCLDFHRIPQGM